MCVRDEQMWNSQADCNFETCLGLEPAPRIMHEEVKRIGRNPASGWRDKQAVGSTQDSMKRNKKSGSVGLPGLAVC